MREIRVHPSEVDGSQQVDNFTRHFGSVISQGLVDFIEKVALLHSRYLFVSRVGKDQTAYCTHCRCESIVEGLRPGRHAPCPACASDCVVKSAGRSRKYLLDDAYVVYFEKSQSDPQSIVARGLVVIRDYRGSFREVETLYAERALYVFSPGQAEMWEQYVYYGNEFYRGYGWSQSKSVHSLMGAWTNGRSVGFCSVDSLRSASQGTPFQYCAWDKYPDTKDYVKYLGLFAKYPAVEYLTKLGFEDLVRAKMYGGPTYNAIRWSGTDPEQVLKLSRHDIKTLRSVKRPVTPFFLYLWQQSKKDGLQLSAEETAEICRDLSRSERSLLDDLRKYANLRQIRRYALKQDRLSYRTRYVPVHHTLSDWRDYLNECEHLGLDLTQEVVLFPKNLVEAHQRTTAMVKHQADERMREKFESRYQSLLRYRMESEKFLIRPFRNQEDLIAEGSALKHCVGSYANRYVSGDVLLFAIRHKSDPESPFYTVEIRGGKVTQCRGFRNVDPTTEVKAFLAGFIAQQFKSRSKSSSPQTKGVAI